MRFLPDLPGLTAGLLFWANMGRPSEYTDAIGDEICDRLANGESLVAICKSDHMPNPSTIYRWLDSDAHDGFRNRYARARQDQADTLADEIISIADDGRNDWMEANAEDSIAWKINGEHVQRSKLRMEARKWTAAKLKPKKYGDRVDLNGSFDVKIKPVELEADAEDL